jgi:hypothetical protein
MEATFGKGRVAGKVAVVTGTSRLNETTDQRTDTFDPIPPPNGVRSGWCHWTHYCAGVGRRGS